jgi:hypothetical protein
MGPFVSFPDITFYTSSATTTAGLVPTAYNVASNTVGAASQLYSLSSSKRIHNGLRLSVKNVGSVAFSANVTAVMQIASNVFNRKS